MTSTQELIGIHNDSAHKSWWKYTTNDKVGKLFDTLTYCIDKLFLIIKVTMLKRKINISFIHSFIHSTVGVIESIIYTLIWTGY